MVGLHQSAQQKSLIRLCTIYHWASTLAFKVSSKIVANNSIDIFFLFFQRK